MKITFKSCAAVLSSLKSRAPEPQLPRRGSRLAWLMIFCLILGCQSDRRQSWEREESLKAVSVAVPPESFFQIVREGDREAARQFYRKYISVDGMPVVASGEVADQALYRTHWLVKHLLACLL